MTDLPLYEPPSLYVTIYCTAGHTGTPWIVATFAPAWNSLGARYWAYSADQYLHGIFLRRADSRHQTMGEVGAVADAPIDRLDSEDVDAIVAARQQGIYFVRHRLRCHICGDSIKRTGPHLESDLDRLAAAGISDVSLVQYRRAMR